MKIKSFDTKEALFDAVQNKGYWSRKGYDVLISWNHAIAINPIKFAKQVELPVRDIRKMTVGGEITKQQALEPKKPVGRQKQEWTITIEEAKKSQSEIIQKLKEGKTYKEIIEILQSKQD